MTDTCLACELMRDPSKLPGGRIHETRYWVVEHCIGPLGTGTLIVKPKRHCLSVSDLSAEESAELGPLLQVTAAVVTELVHPDQVYVCLWSHTGWQPVHIHFVVQPVVSEHRGTYTKPGPFLQVEMFDNKEYPSQKEIKEFARRATAMFVARQGA